MVVLDGKIAIVTGASRGIGAEIARRFSRAGAAVAVAARTGQAGTSPFPGAIGETVQQIRDAGGTAVAIPVDLSRPQDRERLVSQHAVAEPGSPNAWHGLLYLTTEDNPDAEPPAVMAEAALLLCSAEPKTLTGRIAYSQDLLAELRGAAPSAR